MADNTNKIKLGGFRLSADGVDAGSGNIFTGSIDLETETNRDKRHIAVVDGKEHTVTPGTLNGERVYVIDE